MICPAGKTFPQHMGVGTGLFKLQPNTFSTLRRNSFLASVKVLALYLAGFYSSDSCPRCSIKSPHSFQLSLLILKSLSGLRKSTILGVFSFCFRTFIVCRFLSLDSFLVGLHIPVCYSKESIILRRLLQMGGRKRASSKMSAQTLSSNISGRVRRYLFWYHCVIVRA